MRHLFGCPDIVSLTEKFLMARNFFRIFTENNPAWGTGKNISEGVKKSEIISSLNSGKNTIPRQIEYKTSEYIFKIFLVNDTTYKLNFLYVGFSMYVLIERE